MVPASFAWAALCLAEQSDGKPFNLQGCQPSAALWSRAVAEAVGNQCGGLAALRTEVRSKRVWRGQEGFIGWQGESELNRRAVLVVLIASDQAGSGGVGEGEGGFVVWWSWRPGPVKKLDFTALRPEEWGVGGSRSVLAVLRISWVVCLACTISSSHGGLRMCVSGGVCRAAAVFSSLWKWRAACVWMQCVWGAQQRCRWAAGEQGGGNGDNRWGPYPSRCSACLLTVASRWSSLAEMGL